MQSNLQQIFWPWALERYEADSLRDCLLALQESSDLVVLEALFFAWLAEQGRELTATEVRHMEEVIAPWVDEVLVPLRLQRVRWSDHQESALLRREALRLELEAEKTVATLLCETLMTPFSGPAKVSFRSNLSLITSLSCSDDLDLLIAAFER